MNPAVLRIVPNTPLFSLLVLLPRMFTKAGQVVVIKKRQPQQATFI